MIDSILPLLVALGAYFLGAIPFGLLLTRAAGGGDIRTIGSGNIGATNVLRTGRKGIALLTLLLDGGKAALAMAFVAYFMGRASTLVLVAGAAAFIGHCYPLWLGFKGGKGVASYLGLTLYYNWPLGMAALLLWVLLAGFSRRSSVGGIGAPLGVALYAAWAYHSCFLLLLSLIIIWKHRSNLARLWAGTEPRIGAT
jgi:acyl phosphate:glycerol-3-phosphate acyltransferase